MLRHTLTIVALAFFLTGLRAQRYTPTEYIIKLHSMELSHDGTTWSEVFESTTGTDVDLADAASFAQVFGQARPIEARTYPWVRCTLSKTLRWSHPAAPVSLSNQSITVNGPVGPAPDKMTVHWATHAEGGRPNASATGGDGTFAKPFLLGAAADVRADVSTTLRLVFAVSDTLRPQGGGYDLMPPQMFFVSENDSASRLSGSFNTVLYNSTKEVDGTTIEVWNYMSGHGVITFDGAGSWTWTGTCNEYDLLTPAGAVTNAKTRAGRYGVNANGSFWMLVNKEPGTLHGALSSDGEMIFASMYDSPTSHMMIFGVAGTTSGNASALNGNYYFTTYGSSYNAGSHQLRYEGTFGVVAGNGTGAITGSQDANVLQVTNPTTTATFTPPAATLGNSFSDTLSIAANGTMTNATGLGGGFLQSGNAGCIGWDFSTSYQPRHWFGFLVKQSPANSFTNASLNGSYFGGHFGDVYESDNGGSSEYFSGFFKIFFNGDGTANVTVVENREGVIETRDFPQTYVVDSATGIVTFRDTNGDPSQLKGAIGPDAESFILTSQQKVNNVASDQRFLGLGLKQN